MALPNLRKGQQQNATAFQLPSSIMGINAVTSLAMMNEAECVYTYNLVSQDIGMQSRLGFEEWANGWTGGPARTVVTFEGHVNADDKLWVTNDLGIWDVTTQGETAPVQVFTWPVQVGDDVGIGSFLTFTNDGNDLFVLLCDGVNGYHLWTQTTDTWAKVTEGVGAGQISGIDPALLEVVFVWKQRVWFIEKDSSNGWYLDAGVFSGTATKFNFGSQFTAGGPVRQFFNWSLDGGDGLDDLFVAVSGAGDVVIYQGTDPDAAATFALIGTWFIGGVPDGHRFGTEFGGEVYILSVYGLLPISQLLNGSSTNDPNTYLTAKISPFIRAVMTEARESFGWDVLVHPRDSFLFINSPPDAGRSPLAFVQYFGNQSWSMIRDLPKSHTAVWKGEVYWTSSDRNSILIEKGYVDNIWLDPNADGPPKPIEWSLLTSYQHAGEPARYKRVQYIRPVFLAASLPSFSVTARYDYDITEQSSSPPLQAGQQGRWDVGLWNQDRWAGSVEALDNPRGGSGLGRAIAVNLRGKSATEVALIAFDVTVDYGGWM